MELTADKSFDRLEKRVKAHDRSIADENIFLERTEEFEQSLGKFQKTIEEDKLTLIRKIQVASESVGTLKDEYQVGGILH